MPVIEINLDLVDNEVRFQPQVRDCPRKVGASYAFKPTITSCEETDDETMTKCIPHVC